MTKGQQHMIHRAQVEVSSPTWLDTQTTEHWVKGKLLEILDEVLNEFSDASVAQIIDHLHIDCYLHSIQAINNESTRQEIRRQVEQALSHANSNGALKKSQQNDPSLAISHLLFYLNSGNIQDKQVIEKWRQDLLKSSDLLLLTKNEGYALLKSLQSPNAWQRFKQLHAEVNRFDELVLNLLTSHSSRLPDSIYWFNQTNSTTKLNNAADRHQVLHFLVKSCFIPSNDFENYIEENLKRFGFKTPKQVTISMEESETKDKLHDQGVTNIGAEAESEDPTSSRKLQAPALASHEQVYAANAGVILVAPYLPRLFNQLQIEPGLHEEAAQQASLLVHYLATGNTNSFDWQLSLPKLLCGVPYENVIDQNAIIPTEWMEEADQMLTAVITHWSKLGNTSIAGLRQTFLQREGQLELKESCITLKIPEQTEDILLQFIPWSFRMIKLPWMKQLLEIEWA